MKGFLKLILLILSLGGVFWWLVLSPVSFPDDKYSYSIDSSDKKWKLVISPIAMTTPLSLIQGLEDKKYIILFDQNGKYIGQSSPFCFMRFDDYNVLFPLEPNEDLGFLPELCDYSIPIDDKKWWSKIIGFLNY
ncbi:TPA: DUF6201 family protein [Photobacterium damselae]